MDMPKRWGFCKFTHVDPRDRYYGSAAGAIVREDLNLAASFVVWVQDGKYLGCEMVSCSDAESLGDVSARWSSYLDQWREQIEFDVRLLCREHVALPTVLGAIVEHLTHAVRGKDVSARAGHDVRVTLAAALQDCGMVGAAG